MGIDGRQIRAARAILGLSQAGLARVCGVHRNTVNAVEHRPVTDWPSAARIAETLNARGVTFRIRDGQGIITYPVAV